MGVYDPLGDFLAAQPGHVVSLSFRQIESLIGRKLPSAAKDHDWWWANEDVDVTRHVQCKSWQLAGWRVNNVDRKEGTVHFTK
jgi:hypothetical protein